MNRRRFLRGLGAALATVAMTTRLAQAGIKPLPGSSMDGDFSTDTLRFKATERYSSYFADVRAYGIKEDGVEGWSDMRISHADIEEHGGLEEAVVDEVAVRKTFREVSEIYLKFP